MDVVAAVIERQGRILICQRKSTGKHPLKWEFPGGKVEPDEDPRAGLSRELREELAIDAAIGPLIHTEIVHYADGVPIRLEFYQVSEFSGEPANLQFERILWERPQALASYDFLEGDLEFIKKL
jgi:8-oxo-dGTP diphosphatase